MPDPDIARELGSISARLKSLEKRQEGIESKLDGVSQNLQRIEGGKNVALWMFGSLGAAAGVIGSYVSFLTKQ